MRVVVFAYACEPGTGSESGAGWIWPRMLARHADVWVLTRVNNRDRIEAALADTPERERLHFQYVDLPERARFWKRGPKGARFYYLLWQAAALQRARELSREEPFDLVWHLTWANVWMGALAPLLRAPFVYGPVGGGVGMDWRLVSQIGVRGTVFEVGRAMARALARYANPLARLPWRRAALILVQNPETRDWLPVRHRSKAVVFPHVVLDEKLPTGRGEPGRGDARPRTALFVGRLLPWKGVALALRTVERLEDWQLIVCGKGSDELRLKRIARRLGVEHRVRFLGSVPRSRVLEIMQEEADVLLFPSIHDEGGFVVVEALAAGLPVVCLRRGGPPVLGGTAVTPSGVDETTRDLARALRAALVRPVVPYPDMETITTRLWVLLRARVPALSQVDDRVLETRDAASGGGAARSRKREAR